MNETVGNLNFLKDTIYKFKNEIQKFMSDPNYTNFNVMNLRQNVDEIEKNILNKEKEIASGMLFDKNSTRDFYYSTGDYLNLPNIKNNSSSYPYNSLVYKKKTDVSTYYLSDLEKISQSNSNFGKKKNLNSLRNILDYTEEEKERANFKQSINKRRKIDSGGEIVLNRKLTFKKNKDKDNLLRKYDVDVNSKNEFNIKRNVGNMNYMDREKLIKYSTFYRNYKFQGISYDDNLRPIINETEMNKGLLSLINKGIIPRNADLTPAFNKDGNPFRYNKESDIIKEQNSVLYKVEYDLGDKIEKIKRDFEDDINNNKNGNLFITSDDRQVTNQSRCDNKSLSSKSPINPLKKIKEVYLDFGNLDKLFAIPDKKVEKNKMNSPPKEILILLFSDFKIVKNETLKSFQARNSEKLGLISYLINQLQKIFRKLNFTFVEVDGNKLEALTHDELKKISVKDLIGCLTHKELNLRGLDPINPNILLMNIKEASICRIQKKIRSHLACKKLKALRSLVKKVFQIQKTYKLFKIVERSKVLLEQKRIDDKDKFEIIMSKFKKNWQNIKFGPRIEIHINSISTPIITNFTIEKFSEKENNQLARLISLADPDVEIIYISPYHISNEVLSYYFSILQSLGVENAKERFHLIVPEMKEALSPGFSLAKLLYYSSKSISMIRNFIKGREDSTYIVPGTLSKHDMDLAMYLECPIIMGDLVTTEALFNKSGAKRVFELNEMALPISAWDINSDRDFYNILVNMIMNYPNVNTWIFKLNREFVGRGIAYLVLDRIKEISELRKEKLNKLITEEKFKTDLNFVLRKLVPSKVEIVTSKIYKGGWNDYFIQFLNQGGIIEACPTFSLRSILGSPAIAMFIEPDGNIKCICSYEKLNSFTFRNFGAVSPQYSIPDMDVEMLTDKIGKFLYDKGIIGYVTIELISFVENGKVKMLIKHIQLYLQILFWAIDLKSGLTDFIVNFEFCDFLCCQSSKVLKLGYGLDGNIELNDKENEKINRESRLVLKKNSYDISDCYYFTLNYLIHPAISNLKMKELVNNFRNEQLVFNVQAKNGILFNLPDVLQCGMLGISGISEDFRECMRLMENSAHLFKLQLLNTSSKINLNSESKQRTDVIEITEIFGRIKLLIKKLEEKNFKIK